MVQIQSVAKCLRVIELGCAVHGVTHLIPVGRYKQRDSAGDAEVRHLHDTIRHFGLIQLEHGAQCVNVKGRKIFRFNQQHHLLRVGVCRNFGHVERVVLGAGELHTSGGRTQRLEQRLGGRFIRRDTIKMHLIKTKIPLVVAYQRKHDVHFIIIIAVARRFHNLRNETVQAEVINERLSQFVICP